LAVGIAGCAWLPETVERPVSHALATPTDTALGQLVLARKTHASTQADSGFHLLDNAAQALAARLALADAAQQTLDIQSYAIHADDTTDRLLDALRRAAARGVRLRILLDDFNTSGKDAQVLQLAWVPGIELRLLNPLPGSRNSMVMRVLSSLPNAARLQRRMHNKIFVADNAIAIAGGRNLGATYFGQGSDNNFVDLDVLAAGGVVRELSQSFDQFWNSPLAYPAQSLVTLADLNALRGPDPGPPRALQMTPAPAAPPPGNALGQALTRRAAQDHAVVDLASLPLVWAPSVVLADKPSKLEASQEETQEAGNTLVDGLLQLLSRARQDVLIVSAYFVPGPRMMSQLASIKKRGVRIRVLTNSLAANDAPATHLGYARYRKELLAMGVELYEMRAEQPGRLTFFGSSTSRASLHSKLLVIDGRLLVVGSMNLDPRSRLQNTEVALLILSPELARAATQKIEPTLADGAYKVSLNDGQLRWHGPADAGLETSDIEPDASLGRRLLLLLMAPFAPDEML
jgi:phosphatidylserine/phosphatidylglycerophosphate/cardiolipin synthase-like enzyme